MSDVKDTLNNRRATHGNFVDHAYITQQLKVGLYIGDKYNSLRDTQKEALEMIVHKIGHILAGDPNHVDHWHDIAGYATLVEQELIREKENTCQPFNTKNEGRCYSAKSEPYSWTEVSNEHAIKQPVKENTTQTEISGLFDSFEKAIFQIISKANSHSSKGN